MGAGRDCGSQWWRWRCFVNGRPRLQQYGAAQLVGLLDAGRRTPAARRRPLLGTDLLGRDLLSRILYGARTSLVIGIVANGLAMLIGALVGRAGFFRGWVGTVYAPDRPDDGLPGAAAGDRAGGDLPAEPLDRGLVIALVNWVQIARMLHGDAVARGARVRGAARALGAGERRSWCATCCRICCRRSSSGHARHLDQRAA